MKAEKKKQDNRRKRKKTTIMAKERITSLPRTTQRTETSNEQNKWRTYNNGAILKTLSPILLEPRYPFHPKLFSLQLRPTLFNSPQIVLRPFFATLNPSHRCFQGSWKTKRELCEISISPINILSMHHTCWKIYETHVKWRGSWNNKPYRLNLRFDFIFEYPPRYFPHEVVCWDIRKCFEERNQK